MLITTPWLGFERQTSGMVSEHAHQYTIKDMNCMKLEELIIWLKVKVRRVSRLPVPNGHRYGWRETQRWLKLHVN